MILGEQFFGDVNWTLVFGAIMTLATVGMWWDARKKRETIIAGQPVSVEVVKALHEEFASKQDFKEQIFRVDASLALITKDRQEDLRLAAQSRRGIYTKIEESKDTVSKQSEEIRRELSGKIDDLPGRVITILKNTGAIG